MGRREVVQQQACAVKTLTAGWPNLLWPTAYMDRGREYHS